MLSVVGGAAAGYTLGPPGRLQRAARHSAVRAQGFPDLDKGAGIPSIEKPKEPELDEPDAQRGARLFGGLAGGTSGGALWSLWDGAGLSACSPFDPEGCTPSKGSLLNRGGAPGSASQGSGQPLFQAEDLPFGIGDALKNPTSVLRARHAPKPSVDAIRVTDRATPLA